MLSPCEHAAMDNVLNFVLGAAAIFGALIALLVLVSMLERRMTWPYGPPKATHDMMDPSGYGADMVKGAQAQGFTFLGWADDQKGRAYKLTYGMAVSPDRGTLAIIGIGTLLGKVMACTWIHSPSADRQHAWVSLDNPEGVESDLLGQRLVRVVKRGPFERMWASHQEWVASKLVGAPFQFPPGEELRAFAGILRERFDLMARTGLIRYTNAENTRWRYTLFGSLRLTLRNLWTVTGGLIMPRRT
jgi:hypothetical protein